MQPRTVRVLTRLRKAAAMQEYGVGIVPLQPDIYAAFLRFFTFPRLRRAVDIFIKENFSTKKDAVLLSGRAASFFVLKFSLIKISTKDIDIII